MIERVIYFFKAYRNLIMNRFREFRKSQRYRRYIYLIKTIREKKCRRIMEIGTWNGEHARWMIEEAKKYHGNKVEYYGFDLFELKNEKLLVSEYGAKTPPTELEVKNKLEQTGVKVHLLKGNTKETLAKFLAIKPPKMDLIFIDGGHSTETIANDWEFSRQLMHAGTIVLFDDYWNRNDAGCKAVVEKIDKTKYAVEILKIQDKFEKKWGILKINLVKVMIANTQNRDDSRNNARNRAE